MIERAILVVALTLAGWSCGGAQKTDETIDLGARTPSEEDTAMLDEEVEVDTQKLAASREVVRMELPETPENPKYEIDGDRKDWDRSLFRSFTRKSNVESGASFWRGRSDLSFEVGADADAGFLYFFVDVTDDVVISDDSDELTDGVIITIRDPNLDAFVKSVPPEAKMQELVNAETALVFLPDGRFRRFRSNAPLPDNMGFVNVMKHDDGYRLEVAFQLEAFEQIGQIPLRDIAFRVDVLDGDEKDRPGTQSFLSMLPDRGNDDPRMALFDAGGLLPHYPIAKAPPRKNAIGAWQVADRAWSFRSFERVSKYWVTVDDAAAFEKAIQKAEGLDTICGTARRDVALIDAYESRGGSHRAGLIVCGARAPDDRCPQGAETDVYWVLLKQNDGGNWYIAKDVNVFGKSLDQCATKERPEKPFYSRFSLYPMDMINSTMWAIGWTRTTDEDDFVERVNGIAIIDANNANPIVGSAITEEMRSNTQERSRVNARVYLAYVDRDENLDICQVEQVHDQSCSGLDRGCRTYENGRTILTTVHLYNPRTKRFERYELSKHRGCTSSFDFASREGFLLLQTRGRVGFLPSPKQSDEIEAKDLF